ncbi:MAG TPA: sulfotransferase [Terriglobales bacterium]|nr:sulfotransferase [Terriglobales bacterium]
MSRLLTDEVRRQLRYVKVGSDSVDLASFPDFLIIGPQRTGTTWLHANLREHPEVMLSEPKELFFFSRLKTRDSPKFQSDRLEWYLSFFREPLWRQIYKHALCLRHLGELYRPKVRGEATASYAAIDADVIDEIVALRPDVRAIMMIRDPVERAWSHAKKDLVRNRKREMKDVSDADFESFFRDPYQLRCAEYVENYDNWAARLQAGHLFVGFFDDIATRPEAFLTDVMNFLGIRADPRYVGRLARAEVNPTGRSRIPEHHRRFLEDLFREQDRKLKQRFHLEWPRSTQAREI